MKKYNYKGFENPIIVDDNGKITYRGYEVEKYCHSYKAIGMASGFSIKQLAHSHYVEQMQKIDKKIEEQNYKNNHKKEFENLHTADEDVDFFLNMINN